MIGGYTEEACAWREWLLRAVAGNPSQLNIMYGLAGERRLTELELQWLPGYAKSAPVRIGNAACEQFQLDVYGELMDAMHLARRAGLAPDENPGEWSACSLIFWSRPGASRIMESGRCAGRRGIFTHSKVMAWVAIDRMVKAVERFGLEGPVERWRGLRATIHEEVCRSGFDHERNTFVQYYGGKDSRCQFADDPAGRLFAGERRARKRHGRCDRARSDDRGLCIALSNKATCRCSPAG